MVSTMKLVDSAAEQVELERILETSKPPAPAVHFLIATPFRYPSPVASRFRAAGERGIWYGSETIQTACTELGYWRWRFLTDSDGLRDSGLIVSFTVFPATVAGRALDLSQPPWDALRRDWTSDDYTLCQRLAVDARRRGVEWLRYWSARHVTGHCGAVFEPTCLSALQLSAQQTWHCKVTATSAFMRHDTQTISMQFPAPAADATR
ncbi:MAG TPA: RES family NAD+ phosphorylase [Caldimonas sp.]|nr:RES family NAD+ phosphorylase [Caldimonas sp.]HEX4235985.1 RES family NAD+ phosphorylase [Caldimonas sp.]